MTKTKINNLLKDIEGTICNFSWHTEGCYAHHNSGMNKSCNCGLGEEIKEVLGKLRELRAELGIWDK